MKVIKITPVEYTGTAVYFENPRSIWLMGPGDTDKTLWKFYENGKSTPKDVYKTITGKYIARCLLEGVLPSESSL